MTKKPNLVFELAFFFVTEILEREWTDTDFKGMHMRHAKDALKDYSVQDICGCLSALKDGVIGDLPTHFLKSIAIINSGEPPYIQQWKEYRETSPPIWMETSFQAWQRRTGGLPVSEKEAPNVLPQ